MQAYCHCSEWMSQNSLLMSCCKEAEDPNKSPQDCVYRSKASTAGRVVGHEADWPRSPLSPLSTSIHPSARERCKAVNSIGLETVFLLQDLSNLQCTRTTFYSFIHSFIHQSIHTCIQCDFFLQVMRSIAIASEACLLRSRVTSRLMARTGAMAVRVSQLGALIRPQGRRLPCARVPLAGACPTAPTSKDRRRKSRMDRLQLRIRSRRLVRTISPIIDHNLIIDSSNLPEDRGDSSWTCKPASCPGATLVAHCFIDALLH